MIGDVRDDDISKIQLNNVRNEMIKHINKFMTDNDLVMETWCREHGIEKKAVAKYISDYVHLVMNYVNDNDGFNGDVGGNGMERTNVIKSFLMGYCFNICKRIHGSKYFISAYSPDLYNIYAIESRSTYVNSIFLEGYILYIRGEKGNKLVGIQHIDPKYLSLIGKMFKESENIAVSDFCLLYTSDAADE